MGMDSDTELSATLCTEIQKATSASQSIENLTGGDFRPNEKNALLPISRLHEEILVIIFQYAIEPDDEDRRKIRDVQNVMNVCQRWYGIVLGFPAFWTSIDLSSASLANEMVERAQSLSISINLYQSRFDLHARLDSRLFDMSRIGGLKFSTYLVAFYTASRQWCNDYVYSLLDMYEGISTLRSLHFSRFSSEHPMELPLRLFPPSPRLQHLQLDGCFVSWESLDVKSLSELHFLDLDDISCPDTLEQLCSILSVTQKLQKLFLSCYRLDGAPLHLCSVPTEAFPSRSYLPRLISIRLKAWMHVCVSILTYISYPANARVDFETRGSVEDPFSFLPSLLNHESISKNSEHCNLRIDHRLESGTLELWDGPVDRFLACTSGGLAPSNPPTRIRYSTTPMPRVLAALTVPRLQLLDLGDFILGRRCDEGCSIADWRSFFDRHPEITHLRSTMGDFTRIATALSSAKDRSAPLPRLCALFLNARCDIRIRGDNRAVEDIQALLGCLTDRHRHGQVLETLAISLAFEVGEKELRLLKEVVQSVMEI